MILRGSHHTRYDYATAVEFGPHLLYLRPREDARQRLVSYSCVVRPEADLFPTRDAHDNALTWAHFRTGSSSLAVQTHFTIEVHDPGFRFILSDYASEFPFRYEPVLHFALAPYLAPPFAETQVRLRAWSESIFRSGPGGTVERLMQLNRALFQTLTYRSREEAGIQPAAQTLATRSGSCRDYAVLLMEVCRTLGVASRFVSGYLYAPPDGSTVSTGPMHAWVEVYLPGAGWVALDPTHGCACDDTYVAVAHAAQADVVNPLQGSYAGGVSGPTVFHTTATLEIDRR